MLTNLGNTPGYLPWTVCHMFHIGKRVRHPHFGHIWKNMHRTPGTAQILVAVIHHFPCFSMGTYQFQKPAIGSSSIRSLRCQFYAFTHREARVMGAAVIWPPGLHIIVSKNADAPNGPVPVFSSELVHFVALLLDFSNVLTCLQRIFRYSWLNSGWQWRKKPVLVSSCMKMVTYL